MGRHNCTSHIEINTSITNSDTIRLYTVVARHQLTCMSQSHDPTAQSPTWCLVLLLTPLSVNSVCMIYFNQTPKMSLSSCILNNSSFYIYILLCSQPHVVCCVASQVNMFNTPEFFQPPYNHIDSYSLSKVPLDPVTHTQTFSRK